MGTKISDLSAIATMVADDDVTVVVQSGVTKKAAYSVVRDYLRWQLIAAASYTTTPASTSRITMSDTSAFLVGLPVKYTYGAVTYYGIVTAVSANAYIDIAGAPLDTGVVLTALYVGLPEMVMQVDFYVDANYGDGAADLLATDMFTYFKWRNPAAYLVKFSVVHATADTGVAQPKINVKVAGSSVSTNDSNNGIQLSTAGTWVDNSAVAISAANYDIAAGDAIEVRCTAAGTNGDASDLTVSCLFVIG